MKRLLALIGMAVCMLVSGCTRSYNTNSTASHARTYSTYRTTSSRSHENRSHRGSGSHHHHGGDSHHHHHDGDHDKRGR